jgi:hypothetical protein
VAYVRFASVYRQFPDVETFKAELEEMLKEKNSAGILANSARSALRRPESKRREKDS